MAFVDVFVDVLDGLNSTTNLDINMSVIFQQEKWAVWHNPAVIGPLFAFHCGGMGVTSVSWEASIIPENGVFAQWLGKFLRARAFRRVDAGRLAVSGVAGSVQHVGGDGGMESRLLDRVGDLRTDGVIDVVGGAEAVTFLDD